MKEKPLIMTCHTCKIEKPREAFRPSQGWFCIECDRAKSRAWRIKNHEKALASDRAYHHANREKQIDGMRRRNYGITGDEYRAMIAAQGGCCAVCRQPFAFGRKMGPHVDHCHETNVVRAILCGLCNVGLGAFGENPDKLRAAIAYVGKHHARKLRSA